MRFSPPTKSSPHCLPSPDGTLVATLFPGVVNIRQVESLQIINVIKLPQDMTGPILGFRWSPTSQRILVAVEDQIHVFSALQDNPFHADIRNPTPPGARPAFVDFDPSGSRVFICSSFGLKFSVFDLQTLKASEISNPKFFSGATASRGFSVRRGTRHLALLTRSAGKDMVSIHSSSTLEVLRSWSPDTIDAQGLVWSPDGQWLVVWESAGQGHKVLFYTPDGHVFRTWMGPQGPDAEDRRLGAGVKAVQFSPDAKLLAAGDSTRCICIINMESVSEGMRLQHPAIVEPRDTLQVWQEQGTSTMTGHSVFEFVKATQTLAPPGRAPGEKSESKTGISRIVFDSTSALVATKLEDFPTTIWIWDVQSSELRSVLMFHAPIVDFSWHPKVRETLLVQCDGEQNGHMSFVWDPLSEGPRSISFRHHRSEASRPSKVRSSWLNVETTDCPTVFFTDGIEYMFACMADSDQDMPPWQVPSNADWPSAERRAESPLELVPAGEIDADESEDDELDDTFHFKREV